MELSCRKGASAPPQPAHPQRGARTTPGAHPGGGRHRRSRGAVRLPALLAGALVATGALGCREQLARAPRARDIVLVVVDALRADRVPSPGHPQPATPNLGEIAREAVVYTRATSPATWCAPALGSLLTGRWPSFHGAERPGDGSRDRSRGLDANAETLAEILGRAGYRTAAFVGNAGALGPSLGFARGFEEYDAAPELGRASDAARRVSEWLARRPEPAFVLVELADARAPYAPPAELAEHLPRHEPLLGVSSEAAARAGGLTPAVVERLVAQYDAAVAAADSGIGALARTLRAQGRWEEALVVVTADHGELLGEHGLVGHGRPPYEPELHVPLLVKYPRGRRAGERVARRVSTLGVFATVLDAARAGASRAQARPLDERHPVWVEDIDPGGRRMRAGYDGADLKLVSVADQAGEVACAFDLRADPGETVPDCSGAMAADLRLALESFGRRARPPRHPDGLASGSEPETGGGLARAAD